MSFGKHFKDSDFTLYEKNGDIFSLQMKFDNIFRNKNLPAMTGGSRKHLNTNNGVHTRLSVPLGLAMLNKKLDTNTYKDLHTHSHRQLDGGVIKSSMYDKLLSLADERNSKKSKSKTRRKRSKKKRKTRKFR